MIISTKIFLFFLVAFLITGCASTFALNKADELANKGEWDEAVLIYGDLARKEPERLEYKSRYRKARFEAAQIHMRRGQEHLGRGNHEASLLELQAALVLDPSLEKAKSELKKARDKIDSLYYYGRGIEQLKAEKEWEAKYSFRRAVSLDKENSLAKEELDKLKMQQKVTLDGFELDLKSHEPITIEFKDAGVKRVFEVLSRLSGISFVFDEDVRDTRTTLFLKNATFLQALDLTLLTNKLAKKVVSDNTIIIYSQTAQKIQQYEELLVRVFYLTNSDAKKTVNLLRTMIRVRDIIAHEELNAIVVRARPEALELAQKILDSTDLADSEVMLAVEILEINRNKAMNLGLEFTSYSVSAAVPTTDGTIKIGNLRKLSSGELLIGLPTAILNFKKEDLDANILANPRIRVKNNSKAKIHIGDRVPIITTTVNQGVSTESIQYQDVGLKLSVEPSVRKDEEVDLKVGLEVSSLGTKTTTASGSVAYQIGTRNAETVLRLHDGETQIIGGLINDEERSTITRIPLLGDVPLIGRLFAKSDTSKVKTDILLSITPYIVRKLEVPEEAEAGIPSGRDEFPSARPIIEGFMPDVTIQPTVSFEPQPLMPPPTPPSMLEQLYPP